MDSKESSVIDIQIGDVVQVGYFDRETRDVRWTDEGVVMSLGSTSVGISRIVEVDDELVLTTIGTEFGMIRHVEGASRWSPTQAAIGMIEGAFGDISKQRRETDNFRILRRIAQQVDELRESLIIHALSGPVEYGYTPEYTPET